MKDKWLTLTAPGEDGESIWELFHESSKTSRFAPPLPSSDVIARMRDLCEALPYDQCPVVDLPREMLPLDMPLAEAILSRTTARQIVPRPLTLAQLGTILFYAYGITRANHGTVFPRPFRTVPSGGALYPLEIFLHATRVESLRPGFYQFNPEGHHLRLLQEGDETRSLCAALVQNHLALDTSALLFLTAVFERSIFKYGNRGYRFVLLEAGHVMQNINLVTTALGLGCVNIGGFFDRQMDHLLGIDGVTHSTLYLAGLGENGSPEGTKDDTGLADVRA